MRAFCSLTAVRPKAKPPSDATDQACPCTCSARASPALISAAPAPGNGSFSLHAGSREAFWNKAASHQQSRHFRQHGELAKQVPEGQGQARAGGGACPALLPFPPGLCARRAPPPPAEVCSQKLPCLQLHPAFSPCPSASLPCSLPQGPHRRPPEARAGLCPSEKARGGGWGTGGGALP